MSKDIELATKKWKNFFYSKYIQKSSKEEDCRYRKWLVN